MSAEATGWVWKRSPYKGHHAKFLLHLAVADVVNDAHGNEFWMCQSALAEKTGTGVRVVSTWLADAVERGLLVLVGDGSKTGRPNRYRMVMAEGGTQSEQTGYAVSAGGVRSDCVHNTNEHKGTEVETLVNEEGPTAIAERVVAAWVFATGRDPKRTKVNAKRLAAVKARLREGYSEQDLVAAARGIGLSAWHMGDNPDRKKYDDLLVAIRDGERVEKFRDLFEQGGDRGPGSAVDRLLETLSSPSGERLALEEAR